MVIKLLAPYLPYITEELYQGLFRRWEGAISVHAASWPEEQAQWRDAEAESFGEILLDLLRKVRRHKAERGLSVGAELATLYISMPSMHRSAMEMAQIDLRSATRAKRILVETDGERAFPALQGNDLLLEV